MGKSVLETFPFKCFRNVLQVFIFSAFGIFFKIAKYLNFVIP